MSTYKHYTATFLTHLITLKADIINSILTNKESIREVNDTSNEIIGVCTGAIVWIYVCKILGLCSFTKLGFHSIQKWIDQMFVFYEYLFDYIK